jgi:hypothetical protein
VSSIARDVTARPGIIPGVGDPAADPPAELRAGCAAVAARARHVQVDDAAIPRYAGELARAVAASRREPPELTPDRREDVAARWLTLDAINFGSGWFPTLRKRRGLSGYRTIAAGLAERFDADGPWRAHELARIDAVELAALLGQDPAHELIGLFARSLRDLGGYVQRAGGFAAVVDAAAGSAVALAAELGRWRCFADASTHGEIALPFLKRAQIAAADLHRAGVVRFADLGRLTIFADNLVPHVLALDGVLRLHPALRDAIARGDLLVHGSEPEVELRACAVHACELLVAEVGGAITAAELDGHLWERGAGPRYKASPRPRCRCTAY